MAGYIIKLEDGSTKGYLNYAGSVTSIDELKQLKNTDANKAKHIRIFKDKNKALIVADHIRRICSHQIKISVKHS